MANTLMDAPDVLKKIAAYKVDEVATLRDDISIEELRLSLIHISEPTRPY